MTSAQPREAGATKEPARPHADIGFAPDAERATAKRVVENPISTRSATAPQLVMTSTINARPQRTRRLTFLLSSRAAGRLPATDAAGMSEEQQALATCEAQ
jgi:hypothetical protein